MFRLSVIAVLGIGAAGALLLVLSPPLCAAPNGYYAPAYSHFTGSLAGGTLVYFQVDAAHPHTTYGGVLESHEIVGGDYDNISRPVER